jgi:hypothetical protein
MDLGFPPKTEPLGLGFGSQNARGGGVRQGGCPEVGERGGEVVGVHDRAAHKGGWAGRAQKPKNELL